MKKITPNGNAIKQLREQLDNGSLQKEMAHSICISERMLRLIENNNAQISIATLDRIATYLSVRRDQIAYSIDAPKLVPSMDMKTHGALNELFQDRIIPRFDKDMAYATMDEGQLIQDTKRSEDLTAQIDVQFNKETSEYAEELLRLLTPLTWSKRDWSAKHTPADEIALHRRIRQILVLLKGNDVWLYYTHHMRHLPERFELPAPEEARETNFRVAIVFGPPGEYGEVSVSVDVDNGQPYFLKGWNSKNQESE